MAGLERRLGEYRDAGVQHAVLALTSGDVPRLRGWMQAVAASIPLG
jgi:hypothetical protein